MNIFVPKMRVKERERERPICQFFYANFFFRNHIFLSESICSTCENAKYFSWRQSNKSELKDVLSNDRKKEKRKREGERERERKKKDRFYVKIE